MRRVLRLAGLQHHHGAAVHEHTERRRLIMFADPEDGATNTTVETLNAAVTHLQLSLIHI
eukprot:6570752-Pyramimonas_sp.AAC.1